MPRPRPPRRLLLPLGLVSCLSSGTGPDLPPADPRPAAPPIAAPAIPGPSHAREALRAAHPHPIALDPARDRDGWFDKARLLADTAGLARRFRDVGYTPPSFSRALVVVVRPGVGQPRYFHHSLDDTAFTLSTDHFHPASTVKLAASVGALWTVGALGLGGDVELAFTDAEGEQRGRLADMIDAALLRSSNRDYNRLVRIAGFDALNDEYLAPRWGLPHMTIQARYGDRRGPTLRSSPAMRWRSGDRRGVLPAREAVGRNTTCEGNCATLFELHDVQRRVVLHEELPADQRFPIAAVDVARMRATMLRTRTRLGEVADEAFGAPVEVFKNVGRIPGRALLENATLIDRASGRRVFMVASVAFPRAFGDSDAQVVPRLRALARPSLDHALAAACEGPGLQHDVGAVTLSVAHAETGGLLVEVDGAEARAWIDRRPMIAAAPGMFTLADVPAGDHVVVVELGPVAAPTAYRASLITAPAPSR